MKESTLEAWVGVPPPLALLFVLLISSLWLVTAEDSPIRGKLAPADPLFYVYYSPACLQGLTKTQIELVKAHCPSQEAAWKFLVCTNASLLTTLLAAGPVLGPVAPAHVPSGPVQLFPQHCHVYSGWPQRLAPREEPAVRPVSPQSSPFLASKWKLSTPSTTAMLAR